MNGYHLVNYVNGKSKYSGKIFSLKIAIMRQLEGPANLTQVDASNLIRVVRALSEYDRGYAFAGKQSAFAGV